MEDIRDTIGNNDSHPATTIVSTMTTVTGNGTSVTLITPETVDNFEPDPKWEMTTLEKASYEPTAQAQERQEDRSVFDPCILSQSSVDTQLEKVIDDIVELDRCQQFDQSTGHNQNIMLDKEKEVANIQRWISGNYPEESEKANINDKVQQNNQLSSITEKSEQQEPSATLQLSNHDLKQIDNMTALESSLAVPNQVMNDQDLPKTDALSSEAEMQKVTNDPVENNEIIEEINSAEVVETIDEPELEEEATGTNEEAAVPKIDADGELKEVIETNTTGAPLERTSVVEDVEIKKEEASGTIEDKAGDGETSPCANEVAASEIELVETNTTETVPFQASDTTEAEAETKEEKAAYCTDKHKISEIDGDEAPGASHETVAPDTTMDDASASDEISSLDIVQEESFEKNEERAEANEDIAFGVTGEEISEVDGEKTSIAAKASGHIEEREDLINNVGEAFEDVKEVSMVVKKRAPNNVEQGATIDVKETAFNNVEEDTSKTVEAEVPDNVEAKSPVAIESKTRGSRLARSSSGMKRKTLAPTPTPAPTPAPAPTSPGIRRRSKRAKVDCKPPQVEIKVEEKKVEKTAEKKRDERFSEGTVSNRISSTDYKCTHCEFGSSRIDNTIYHMKHKMCKPLQKMWNDKCENYKKQMTPQKSSSSGRKRTTR